MTVLIITHKEDNACIDMVTEHLTAMGSEVFRFDTEGYPNRVGLSVGYGKGARRVLENERGCLDLDKVEAVWYRRVRVAQELPRDMDPQLRAPSIEETRRCFFGMLNAIPAFSVDNIQRVRRAEHKQLQLKVAQEVGLAIPDTLISNNAEEVRAFAKHHTDGIIAKMMTSFAVYREGEEHVVFTNVLSPDDLYELEGLELCPMTFQARVPKEIELRVTVVGHRIFCAAVDSQAEAGAEDDWRKRGAELVDSWQPHTLPDSVCQQIHALMDFFGLNYGAIDLILTPTGEYVFLEVNPCGEWFWLDQYANQPIAQTLAETLLCKVPVRY